MVIIAGLALMAMTVGCAGPAAGGPVGWMEVRLEADAGTAGAESFRDADGGILWFAEPQWYPLSFVGRTAGRGGEPLVSFEVAVSHREDFRLMTERNVDRRMGVFADGELLAAPQIATGMDGRGVLSGAGWDLEQCTQVRRALLSQQPPAGADL